MGDVLVAPISFGLGDLVVSLPVIQALVAEGAGQVRLVARSHVQALLGDRIRGLAGWVAEDRLTVGAGERLVDLRDHRLQRDHWWGSAAFVEAFGAMDINDIVACIAADAGIAVDLSAPAPLLARPRRGLQDTVLFVHETDGPDKAWPPQRWARTAALVHDVGLRTLLVTRAAPSPAMRATGISHLVAPTPGDAVDVLSSCRAVIGVDTGLTHVAVQQRTPTVTICRENSVYVRPWPHSRALRGAPCTAACRDMEAGHTYNERISLAGFTPSPWRCPVGAACLDTTTPLRAVAMLQEIL